MGHGASEDRKGAPSTPISIGGGVQSQTNLRGHRSSLASFPLCVRLALGS